MRDGTQSTAAIFGHPIHPMLVPVPIGALAAAFAADVAWTVTRDEMLPRASRWLLGLGLAGVAMAAPFGVVDLLTMRRARRRPEAWLHAGGNVAAAALTLGSLALRRDEDDEIPMPAMALTAATGALLMVTGWLGGELSYRHRIGVAEDAT